MCLWCTVINYYIYFILGKYFTNITLMSQSHKNNNKKNILDGWGASLQDPTSSEVLSFQVETKPGCNKANGLHGTLKTSWNQIGIYLDLAKEPKKGINPWICRRGRRICSVWYGLCALCSSAWKFPRKYSQRWVSGYLSTLCVTLGNCTRRYFRCCPNHVESLKEILASMTQCHMSDTHIHKFNIKCWALIFLIGKTAMKTSCWKSQLLGESRAQDAAQGTGHFFGPFSLHSSTKGCAVLKVQEMSHRAFLSFGDLMLTLS